MLSGCLSSAQSEPWPTPESVAAPLPARLTSASPTLTGDPSTPNGHTWVDDTRSLILRSRQYATLSDVSAALPFVVRLPRDVGARRLDYLLVTQADANNEDFKVFTAVYDGGDLQITQWEGDLPAGPSINATVAGVPAVATRHVLSSDSTEYVDVVWAADGAVHRVTLVGSTAEALRIAGSLSGS